MAREFRPYINKSLGQVPNLNIRYVIGDGEIKTYKAFLGLGESYKGSHVISAKTKANAKDSNILGYGKVIVSTEGDKDEYENIGEVASFIAAIETEQRALKKKDSAWHNNVLSSDFENFAVQIPKPDYEISHLHYNPTEEYLVKVGDYVDEGQVMANVPWPVRAPFNGKVNYVGTISYGSQWNLCDNWPEAKTVGGQTFFGPELFANILFAIQPLKGAKLNSAVFKSYAGYTTDATAQVNRILKASSKELSRMRLRADASARLVENNVEAKIASLLRATPRFNMLNHQGSNDHTPTADKMIDLANLKGNGFDVGHP